MREDGPAWPAACRAVLEYGRPSVLEQATPAHSAVVVRETAQILSIPMPAVRLPTLTLEVPARRCRRRGDLELARHSRLTARFEVKSTGNAATAMSQPNA